VKDASKLLYDPDCGFCKVTAATLLTWDLGGELRPVALGSPEADRLLAELPEAERMASWHLVEPSGEVSSAGAGFAPLLSRLPAGWPLALVARTFPDEAELAYRLVANNRTPLGRLIPGLVKRQAERVIRHRQTS
jgi:predicted DCC family thiol-disulfide oxidoreductase YuxK